MRLEGGRRSENVEDRRGMRGPVMVGGGLGTLVLVLLFVFLGKDPQPLLKQIQQQNAQQAAQPGPKSPEEERQKVFVEQVLAQTEDVWTNLFRNEQLQYRKPKLVLFSGQVQSACGMASAAVGPFYCPADEKVYLDLEFFVELERRFKAPGDFAQAYVIAHEIGHHVQKQLGISDQVHARQQQLSKAEANELSVRLELQADYFAGVWAHHAHQMKQILEPGDIEEGLKAATAIGDDKLQKQAQGYVVPDSFTHGTSAQRVRWFTRGLQSGDFTKGDTFKLDASEL
jgi:predicted metalloprotease